MRVLLVSSGDFKRIQTLLDLLDEASAVADSSAALAPGQISEVR